MLTFNTNEDGRNRALYPSITVWFYLSILGSLTSECSFFTPFSLTDPALVFALLVMKPILSSFIRELNCFKLIEDLFEPYSLNKLSTKDFAAGPLMLRTSSCEKTWQSVLGINAKKDKNATTQTAFLGIDAKTDIKAATLQTFTDSIEATFISSINAATELTGKIFFRSVYATRQSQGRFTRHSTRVVWAIIINILLNWLVLSVLGCISHVLFPCRLRPGS